MTSSDIIYIDATTHLIQHDPILAAVIKRVGPYPIRSHKNYYQELIESIIGQQLSLKAAASIETRFIELFGTGEFPTPEHILARDVDELRLVGLSRPKARYILDLAQHIAEGKIKFDHLDNLTNEQVIAELTAVKGIGVWTVHMFLLFCMGRLNVLPYGDLGIKNGIQKLYNLKSLPDQKKIETIAKKYKWGPYESVACWYIWKSLEKSID